MFWLVLIIFSGAYFQRYMQAEKGLSLSSNSILSELPESEYCKIASIGKVVRVAADDPIYGFGDAIKNLYFPLNSIFSTSSLMEDGASAEINLIGCEGVVGIFSAFNEQTSRYWTSVLVDGEALKIEINGLRSLIGESELLQAKLLSSYWNLSAQISQRAVCNGRHSLAERFCFWLLLVHDRLKLNELPLTHETIARKLGARRAGITNVAGALQVAEAISYSRGTIMILNRSKLERMSCECYNAVQRTVQVKS